MEKIVSSTMNDEWAFRYFMDTFNGKLLCLFCRESLNVMKEFNCKLRHYETKHAAVCNELNGDLRRKKIKQLKKTLSVEQSFSRGSLKKQNA